VDDQGDKLTTVVDRNKLTTLTTLDVPRRKFSKFTVSNNVPEESRKLQIPFRHSVGQVEERLCQNDRSAVSTAHRLATDRQTDRHRARLQQTGALKQFVYYTVFTLYNRLYNRLYTTGCMNTVGSTTGWVNNANELSQAALERSSQDACDVIWLTRSKAAVWTVDDVARLIDLKKEFLFIYLFIFTFGSM